MIPDEYNSFNIFNVESNLRNIGKLSSIFHSHTLYTEYVELAALVVLPSLLPNSRAKVDVTKIVVVAKVCKVLSYTCAT